MKKFLALLLASAFAFTPAKAMVAATLGNRVVTLSTTNALTTVADCPIGSAVLVLAVRTTTASVLSTVSDSAGNSWGAPFDNTVGTGVALSWALSAKTTVDIPLGATITATFSGATISNIAALCVNGAASSPLDVSANGVSGLAATTSTAINTAVLTQPNEFMVVGLGTAAATGSNSSTGTVPFGRFINGTGTPSAIVFARFLSSTSSQPIVSTWANANNYVTDVISLKATNFHGLLTIGVGQ